MADELSNLWVNLSLSVGEDGELEIQAIEVKRLVKRGKSCVVGKLMSESMVSMESIKTTLTRWW